MKDWPGNEPSSKRWDLLRDYLCNIHRETLNSRQTFLSVRITMGNGEAHLLWSVSTLEKAADFRAGERFILCGVACGSSLEPPQCSMDRRTLYTGLRQEVTSHSPLRSGLNPRAIHVEPMVEKVELGEVFLWDFWFNIISSIPPKLHSHLLIYHLRYIIFANDSFFR